MVTIAGSATLRPRRQTPGCRRRVSAAFRRPGLRCAPRADGALTTRTPDDGSLSACHSGPGESETGIRTSLPRKHEPVAPCASCTVESLASGLSLPSPGMAVNEATGRIRYEASRGASPQGRRLRSACFWASWAAFNCALVYIRAWLARSWLSSHRLRQMPRMPSSGWPTTRDEKDSKVMGPR